ncbi:hypothetical protein [Paraburkholderia domus]|uniref:hypothetical protein n=1 Tax=Paraburkholderia domus TaxID=2793075 RepID=UPI001B8BF830|nr:hypothetical protein [Paraburkholderia domus]
MRRPRSYAPATRDEATGAATIPFPEQVTVLAAWRHGGIGGQPEAPATADGPTEEGSSP